MSRLETSSARSRATFVLNGWAAGPETWYLTTFPHDWLFSYIEQLDGIPERVMDDFDDVLLVGFSMGSMSALRLFLAHPEKVRGLVLVSGTACMGARENWLGMNDRRRAAFKLGTHLVFANDPSPIYDVANLDRGLDFINTTDLRADLLACPAARSLANVAVFQSERDGIVRPHNAAFLKRVFPAARVTMVPGNEHVLPLLIPEQIDQAVKEMQS